MKNDFLPYIADLKNTVEADLDYLLPKEDLPPTILHKAQRYVCLNGGKRIRSIFMYLASDFLNVDHKQLKSISSAVEIIHAYTLTHDDLPAMDDDALRRGKPSCHIKFDEATAILVGDSLQAFAFEIIAKDNTLSNEQKLTAIKTLANTCGTKGLVGGQILDMQAENKDISLAELENIHKLKTQSLFSCCAKLVSSLNENGDEEKAQALLQFANIIGLAFQINDDIIDFESSTEVLGKPSNSDQKNNKTSFYTLLGEKKAHALLDKLYKQASEIIRAIDNNSHLIDFAHYVLANDMLTDQP